MVGRCFPDPPFVIFTSPKGCVMHRATFRGGKTGARGGPRQKRIAGANGVFSSPIDVFLDGRRWCRCAYAGEGVLELTALAADSAFARALVVKNKHEKPESTNDTKFVEGDEPSPPATLHVGACTGGPDSPEKCPGFGARRPPQR